MTRRPSPDEAPPPVVLDTNILVAAGFARESASAALVDAVRRGALRMIWNDGTRREIEHILRKIPPLRRQDRSFFRDADRLTTGTDPGRFTAIPDPDDRVFAALAYAAGATLVSNDDHLLAHRDALGVEILTPGEFRRRYDLRG